MEKRLLMFKKQKEAVWQQIEELSRHMEKIDYKIQYYEEAVKAGTEAIHENCCLSKISSSSASKAL